jgi:hypothetical protein
MDRCATRFFEVALRGSSNSVLVYDMIGRCVAFRR